MQFYLEVTGLEPIALGLEETVTRSADLRELKEPLRDEYFAQNRENLLGEGALTQGWLDLAEVTKRDKARKGYRGKRKEEREGSLFRSLTEASAAGFFERVSESEIDFGSHLPYALAQHSGFEARNLPARPLIGEPKAERYEKIFVEHAAEVTAVNGF